MIVNDDSSIINKFEASLTDDTRVIIYGRHIFIAWATGVTLIKSFKAQIYLFFLWAESFHDNETYMVYFIKWSSLQKSTSSAKIVLCVFDSWAQCLETFLHPWFMNVCNKIWSCFLISLVNYNLQGIQYNSNT
jgi:hypothetical protein